MKQIQIDRRRWLQIATSGALTLGSAGGTDKSIPIHPSQLKFGQLDFSPPDPSGYRYELPHGAVAYLVEDHQLPLVRLGVTIRTGGYLNSDEDLGLASMTGALIRSGGTKSMSASKFDEEAAFFATEIHSRIGATSAYAGIDCLKQNFESSLVMFFDMLCNPAFNAERLALAQRHRLQNMRRRNDRTSVIENREFQRLLRGDSHFSSKLATEKSITSITSDKMRRFHAQYYHPSSLVFAVSGDFSTKEVLLRLKNALRGGVVCEWTGCPHCPKTQTSTHALFGNGKQAGRQSVTRFDRAPGHPA